MIGIIVWADENNNVIDTYVGTIKGHDEDRSIFLITPQPLQKAIKVNYLAPNSLKYETSQYLMPTNWKGYQLTNPDAPYYQQVSNYNIFGSKITGKALAQINRYFSGQIGINFSINNMILDPTALVYKGTFGLKDLPTDGNAGDYYVLDVGSYYSAEAGFNFTYGEQAIYDGLQYYKGGIYQSVGHIDTQTIVIDPASMGELIPIDIDDFDNVMSLLGNMQQEINDINDKLDAIKPTMVYEVELNPLDFTGLYIDKTLDGLGTDNFFQVLPSLNFTTEEDIRENNIAYTNAEIVYQNISNNVIRFTAESLPTQTVKVSVIVNNAVLNENRVAYKDVKNIFTQPQVIPNATANNEVINLGQADGIYAKKVQENWITPTLLNGWTSPANNTLQYMKDDFGRVWFRGTIQGGAVDTTICVLPVGYRPTVVNSFMGLNTFTKTLCTYYVATNGNFALDGGTVGSNTTTLVTFKVD